MPVTAVVPIKALDAAKGRLSDAMAPEQRRRFVAWMAQRVLAACEACPGITETLIVAGDKDAAAIGLATGTPAIVVATPGLPSAMAAADEATADRAATIVVAADLPELTPRELAAVIGAGKGAGSVVIAPTHDGGTGALLRRPPGLMHTAYGSGSAGAHERMARAAGATVSVVRRPGLLRDVDTPDQLPAALAIAAGEDVGCRPR